MGERRGRQGGAKKGGGSAAERFAKLGAKEGKHTPMKPVPDSGGPGRVKPKALFMDEEGEEEDELGFVVLDVFVGREEVGEESDDEVVPLFLVGVGHDLHLGGAVVAGGPAVAGQRRRRARRLPGRARRRYSTRHSGLAGRRRPGRPAGYGHRRTLAGAHPAAGPLHAAHAPGG